MSLTFAEETTDDASGDVILGVTSTEELKDFCVELHPASTGSISDPISVVIDKKKYSLDQEGRVYFDTVPEDMIYEIGIGSAVSDKYYTNTIDKSRTVNGKNCSISVLNYVRDNSVKDEHE